jgi:hypothetical protein
VNHRSIGRREFLTRSALAISGMATTTLFARAGFAADSALLEATVGKDNAALLAAVCERILPTTDTPGAIAAGVPEFIADVLTQVYLEDETQTFLSNLAQFAAAVNSATGAAFTALSDAGRDEALQRLADSADERESDFFNELRQLTVVGYYTSELGAKSETALANPMAPWNGDIAFADVGKVWTR